MSRRMSKAKTFPFESDHTLACQLGRGHLVCFATEEGAGVPRVLLFLPHAGTVRQCCGSDALGKAAPAQTGFRSRGVNSCSTPCLTKLLAAAPPALFSKQLTDKFRQGGGVLDVSSCCAPVYPSSWAPSDASPQQNWNLVYNYFYVHMLYL